MVNKYCKCGYPLYGGTCANIACPLNKRVATICTDNTTSTVESLQAQLTAARQEIERLKHQITEELLCKASPEAKLLAIRDHLSSNIKD